MHLGLREKALLIVIAGVALLGGGTLALVNSIQERLKIDLSRYVAERYVQLHKEKTLGGLQADLALARKMADSDVLRRWVHDQSDAAASRAAVRELGSLTSLFSSHTAFVASKPAGNFYYIDEKALANAATVPLKPAQELTRDDPDDDWFFMTLAQKTDYNFNVDHNNKLNVTKLWVNVVMKEGGEPIGVVGTGTDLTDFIRDFIKTSEKGMTGLYLNEEGAIQETQDIPAKEPPTIWQRLPNADQQHHLRDAMARVKRGDQPSAVIEVTLDGVSQVAAVAYVAPLKWYLVAALDVSHVIGVGHFVPIMMALAVALLIATLLILVVGNRLVVVPMRRLAEGAQRVADGNYAIRLPDDRHDEIGVVAKAFNGMVGRLQDHFQNLDAKVRERTAELEKAYEELKELDRIKGNFLSSISHELRTPTTAIVGFAKRVRKKLDETLPPKAGEADKAARSVAQMRDNLDIIVHESERLSLLIDGVLDSAQLDAGQVEWQHCTLDPTQLLERALAIGAPLAAEKDLALSGTADPALPLISGDENRLLQAFHNLISNAVKFTPHGAIHLGATRAHGCVVFSVADSGIGIAEENQHSIFQRFHQIGDTLTAKPQGTGLGLSICKQIVEHHGGKIWVESQPGRGSTFYFSIPCTNRMRNNEGALAT
ncbi:MAG: sensor histidine kinase [Sulfuricella sp.]|nr:sensor histidine kinase [Sulfuricella sp.]